MKVNITKAIDNDRKSILSHIVIDGLIKALGDSLGEKIEPFETKDGVVMDLVLTAEGIELDIQSFCDHWQSQVSEIIVEEAKRLINIKFNDISDLLYDLEERVKPEISKRLEDWEIE